MLAAAPIPVLFLRGAWLKRLFLAPATAMESVGPTAKMSRLDHV